MEASVNLLRPQQIADLQAEKQGLDAQLTGEHKHRIQFPGDLRKRKQQIDRQLATQSPTPITDGAEKDRLHRRELELRERLVAAAPSEEEMRKGESWIVDREVRFQREKKAEMLEWKNLRLKLNADQSNPNTWDRNVANFEQFRRRGETGRGYRADAIVSGHMSMSSLPAEKYAETFGNAAETPNSALAQAKKAAETRGRKPMTEEQKQAARERLAAARAKKHSKAVTA